MSVIAGFHGGERSATGHCPAAPASGLCGHAHATFARRVSQLYLGLVAFGASLALMVRADLGLGPWDVLHQGLAGVTGLSIGWVVIGGQTLVLVLTLVVTPVTYSLFDDLREKRFAVRGVQWFRSRSRFRSKLQTVERVTPL